MNTLRIPVKIYFKPGSVNVGLKEIRDVYSMKRALLVSNPSYYCSGKVGWVNDFVRDLGISTAEFFSISETPTFAEIQSSLPLLDAYQPDVIIGIGDTAAMSAAKAMYMLYENPELDLAKAVESPETIKAGTKSKLVLIASTFDSGAQTSPFAVLKGDDGAIHEIKSFELLPEISLTDSRFAEGLSPEQIKKDALSLLSTVTRAYSSGDLGDFAPAFLVVSARLVLDHLKDAVAGCPVALEKLLNAGAIAGQAIGNVPACESSENDAFAKALGYEDARAFEAARIDIV